MITSVIPHGDGALEVYVKRRIKTPVGVWIVGMALLGVSVSASAEEASEMEILHHEVNGEETLGAVALQYEISVVELKEWNDLASVHDFNGQKTLEVRLDPELTERAAPRPQVHVVRSGDTFEGIARRYGVRVSQVRQWNRNINPRRLQIGQRVLLHVPGAGGYPVSWGRANQGRLFNGVAMECSPGLTVRNTERAYGTTRTINLLQAAGADVKQRWPDAPELVVGSLSRRNGGPLRPHRSHQSGRDADLTYYHRGNVALPDFRDMTPETFDAVKNWHLFKTLIDTGKVQFIFVDYALQRVLHEYALSIGYEASELEEILQYPRSRSTPVGVIRHARGHRNHFHIRFTCSELDQNCH